MSNSPVAPVAETSASAPKQLTAIERIEQEIGGWIRQKEQAIANIHAIDGAIQGAQSILKILKEEAAKAEAEAKKLAEDAGSEVEKVVEFVKKEL